MSERERRRSATAPIPARPTSTENTAPARRSAEETLAVALSLARYGFHVFPIHPSGRVGRDNGGYAFRWSRVATTDADAIKTAFLVDYPDALIGVYAGASGLVVVDLDAKHGKDGAASLAATGRALPETFAYPSHSGTGSHHWYVAPEGIDLTIGADVVGMAGVDIRAGVGYVRYAGPALAEAPKLAPAPEWSLIRRKAASGAHSAPADLIAWRATERKRKPHAHHIAAVEEVPTASATVKRSDLLTFANGIVMAGLDRRALRWMDEQGCARWTAHPDGSAKDWRDAMAKAIAQAPAPLARTFRDRKLAEPVRWGDNDWGGWLEWESQLRSMKRAERRARKAQERETSWTPVDIAATLDGILDGTLERETPTVLTSTGRDGGLFYAGRVNGVHGESGCGKSWTALLASAQMLSCGEVVVYVDLEDSAAGVVQRLLDLGAPAEAIRRRFLYLNPDAPYSDAAAHIVERLVRKRSPRLVVIDSTGEALAADGAAPNDDDDVARWFRRVPRRIARLGPAVVVLDHSPKATDLTSRLFPIGSHRKRAAIDGAQYLQEAAQAFSREAAGWARLINAKDRHGTYARGEHVASLHVTPTGSGVHVELVAPPKVAPVDKRAQLMERVSRYLEDFPDIEPTTRNVRENVTGNVADVTDAIRALVTSGHVTVTQVGQSQRHRLIKRFRVAGTATTFPLGTETVTGPVPPLGVGTGEPVLVDGSGTGQEPVGTGTAGGAS